MVSPPLTSVTTGHTSAAKHYLTFAVDMTHMKVLHVIFFFIKLVMHHDKIKYISLFSDYVLLL